MAFPNRKAPSSLSVSIDRYASVFRSLFGRLLPAPHVAKEDMNGKTVVITGANSGVGYQIALQLANMGASIYLVCRTTQKAEAARDELLKENPKADIRVAPAGLDTSSLESTRAFATAWGETPIDVIVHNAGIVSQPHGAEASRFTTDGFEVVYQVNFLSSFLLTHLLESRLSPSARIIFTSSLSHYEGAWGKYDFATKQTKDIVELHFHEASKDNPYPQGKYMQTLFALQLQDKFDRQNGNQAGGKLAFSFHPGIVKTNIFASAQGLSGTGSQLELLSKVMNIVGVSPAQGASTGVYLASTKDPKVLGQHRGGYFADTKNRASPVRQMSLLKAIQNQLMLTTRSRNYWTRRLVTASGHGGVQTLALNGRSEILVGFLMFFAFFRGK